MSDKPILVLVSGKLHSGKDTFTNFLEQKALKAGLSVATLKIAQPMKEGCAQDFKDLCVFLKRKYQKLVDLGVPAPLLSWMLAEEENFFEDKTDLTRILLQTYGTNIFRDRVHEDYWTEQFLPQIQAAGKDLILVNDFRFPDEHRILSGAAGYMDFVVRTVRISRAIERNTLHQAHRSEVALDDFDKWDLEYHNDGSLEDLEKASEDFLKYHLIQF